MILKAQKQTVRDKTVFSGLRWYASDRYGLLIMVGGVSGDFSQTGKRRVTLKRDGCHEILHCVHHPEI